MAVGQLGSAATMAITKVTAIDGGVVLSVIAALAVLLLALRRNGGVVGCRREWQASVVATFLMTDAA
jgi:hypothetical protein